MSNITDGLVLRLIKAVGAFDGEEVNMQGLLLDASVNAKSGNHNEITLTDSVDKGNYTEYAVCEAAKITRKGGVIRIVPVPGNPDHCQIHDLSIKDANNLFSHHKTF